MAEKIRNMNDETPYGFAESYEVTLYFEDKPTLDSNALSGKLAERLGGIVVVEDNADSMTVALEEYSLTDGDGGLVEFTVTTKDIGSDQELFSKYLSQSWTWPEAADLTGKVFYQITLYDRIGQGLPYKERLVLFQVALYCLVEYTRPIGLQWDATGQLINPKTYLENVPGTDDYDLLFGALNVRMYSVKDTEDDTVMDTVGMAALGVVDIQCCFYGFDKEMMADTLYHYGTYVFWHGDVIREGQTIEGIDSDDKWGVRHELSQLEPRRPVLNIGPDIKL